MVCLNYLGVEHVVGRLFNRAANHLTKMIPDLCLINFDNFVQVLSHLLMAGADLELRI